MGSIFDIIDGHVNEMFNANEGLYEERMKICKECPLYTNTKIGHLCDKAKYINKDNKIIHGCGCRLDAKARLFDEKCVLNKW